MNCGQYSVPALVIHLPDANHPLGALGMSRLETILAESEKRTVNVAFENLNNLDNLSAMLSRFHPQTPDIAMTAVTTSIFRPVSTF